MSGEGQNWNSGPPTFAFSINTSSVSSGIIPIIDATVDPFWDLTSFTLSITFVFRSDNCYVNMSTVLDRRGPATAGITGNNYSEILGNFIGSTGLIFDILSQSSNLSQVTFTSSGVLVKVF